MLPQDLSFHVTEAVGSGGILSQAAWLFLPDDPWLALWDRMATWIPSVADPESALTAERVAPRV